MELELFAGPAEFVLRLYITAVALVMAGEIFLVGSKKVAFKAMMARKYLDVKGNCWLSGVTALSIGILVAHGIETNLVCWVMFAWFLESQWKTTVLYWYTYSMGFPDGVERSFG